ncbi:hypothetical protein GCM10009828_039260 [Actinoplanes couchii]|uniref:Uncharacterized protein n=1 Tax=Actinoplanes couchii TaxID=403638 RepID=A0ABQ3XGA4_9ACTN|nr:hypothetical protein Aco03nite_059020 [Actinoplanes couchii]
MVVSRARVLYVSDLSYQARGRRYCDEDIRLTSRLRDSSDLALCHPLDARALMGGFDVVVVRNSGPVGETQIRCGLGGTGLRRAGGAGRPRLGHGIQRVNSGRTRDRFVTAMTDSLRRLAAT